MGIGTGTEIGTGIGGAAVEHRRHPALTPEDPLTHDNRVLELRVYWGSTLMGLQHHVRPKRITIGEANHTDVFITSEGLPVETFPLIRCQDDEYTLLFTPAMSGEVEVKGRGQCRLSDLVGDGTANADEQLEQTFNLVLHTGDRAVVHWGGLTFAIRFVPPNKKIQTAPSSTVDLNYVNTLLFSVCLHVGLVVACLVYPYDADALRVDIFDDPDRFATLILEERKATESTRDMLEKIRKSVEEKKAKLKPKLDPDAKPVEDAKQPKAVAKEKSQEQKAAEVKQKFAKLFDQPASGGSLLGGGGAGSLSGTLKNVIGTAGKSSSGAGIAGLGIRSGPLTGGGIGTSKGIAGIGTAGRLGGGGLGYGSGVGVGARQDRAMISLETPVIMGALPKEVILKVINQNKSQIRYCYEVELQRQQNLAGRIAMRWVISATGSVAQVVVRESTLKNANVEACIKKKILTWKFPAPAGGGIVEVNYPFVFKAT